MAAVTFLGTGPGNVVPGRGQSSVLLEIDDTTLLLDAGEPCSGQLLNLGIPLARLDAVWITHAHSDHVGGLPLLLQASWLHGRTAPLPLGLPGHLIDPLKTWLQAVLLPPSTLDFPLQPFAWEAGCPRIQRKVSVTPHPTSHLANAAMRTGDSSIASYLFEIQAGTQRIVYTGDLGAASDLVPVLTQPIDLLICELTHLSVDDLIATLTPAKIGTLCLTHVSGELDDQRGEILMRCESELPEVDEVFLPEDGERIDL